MQIINIGVDIIEINKILKIGILDISQRILSSEEYNLFLSIKNKKNQLNFLAGRWAIKEAIFKTGYTNDNKINFFNYTILNNIDGSPYLKKISKHNKILISLSHSDKYALAFVILTNNNE